MPWLRRRSDLPLARDPTARFLAWITALMVYLASLALAAAMVLADLAQRWDSGLAGSLTVQISPTATPGAPPPDQRMATALQILRATPGVRVAEPLPAEEAARLLEPWLGPDLAADRSLPLPALIDVETAGAVDIAALATRLREAVPGAVLDDHAAWMVDLRAFTGSLQFIAVAIVLLIGVAAVMTVVFAVRAGLAIHRNVVELLHLMGATDRYVSRQFEVHVFELALQGGVGGLALAVGTLLAVDRAGEGLRATLLTEIGMAPAQWLLLAVVPVAACLLAVVTARLTVLRTLETMP